MAEHIWTVLCERHLVDPESKVLSLIDCAETTSVEGLNQLIDDAKRQGKRGALVNVQTQLVSWWLKSDPNEQELRARFVLFGPDGHEVMTQAVTAPWTEDSRFLRIFLKLDKLPVPAPGLFWFAVEHQKTLKSGKERRSVVTRIPFEIQPAA